MIREYETLGSLNRISKDQKTAHISLAMIVFPRSQSCWQVSLKAAIIILRVKTLGLSVHKQKDQLRLLLNLVA
tara:strand:+ start:136 stop:354 length:219 start_codon:yes stop_codon:yes gene_type:complete